MIHHATPGEVARFCTELEIGFSTSASCNGGHADGHRSGYCYVGPKFTVYQAYQVKDTLGLKENMQCIKDRNDDTYCGIIEYDSIYHRIGIRMPYGVLYNYYLVFGWEIAGAGAATIAFLWKRKTRSEMEKARE